MLNDNMTTKILVTGGAGYIGSHACKSLASAGYVPVTYDNLSRGHRSAVNWGPLEVGDLQDRARIDEVLRRHRPRAVLHFAAFAYVGESMDDPASYYENNLAGTLSLLAGMRARGVNTIVFSSTCATYGVPDQQPITERTAQMPINPYGRSKLMIEHVLTDFGKAYGLRSVALRYFNACGADPKGEIGEDHDPEPHLIPRALMAANGEISHLDIFGTDYDTPDGTCVRDYVHVTDLADGHLHSLTYLLDGGESTAFNLGTGRGFSVREIAEAVERITGRAVPVCEAPRRMGDPASLVADPSLARDTLGFRVRLSRLEQIVETAWRWHQRKHDCVIAS